MPDKSSEKPSTVDNSFLARRREVLSQEEVVTNKVQEGVAAASPATKMLWENATRKPSIRNISDFIPKIPELSAKECRVVIQLIDLFVASNSWDEEFNAKVKQVQNLFVVAGERKAKQKAHE